MEEMVELLWCLPSEPEHVRASVAAVEPTGQVLQLVSELETMYSKVVVVAAEGAVASLAVVENGLEPVEPRVAEVWLD